MSRTAFTGHLDLATAYSGGAAPTAQPASVTYPPYDIEEVRRFLRVSLLDDVELSELVHDLIPGSIGEEAAKLIREFRVSSKVFMNLCEDEFAVLVKNNPDIMRSYLWLQGNSRRNRARRRSIVDVFPRLSLQFNSLFSASRHSLVDDIAYPVEEDTFDFEGLAPLPHPETNHLDDLESEESAASYSVMAGTADPSWHHSPREGLQPDLRIPGSAMPEVRAPVHLDSVTGCLWSESPYPPTLNGESFPGEPPPSSINEVATSPGVNSGPERASALVYDHIDELSVASVYSEASVYPEESLSSSSDEGAVSPGSCPSSEKATDPRYDHVDDQSVSSPPSLSSLDSSGIDEALEETCVNAPVPPSHSSPRSLSIDCGDSDSSLPDCRDSILDSDPNITSESYSEVRRRPHDLSSQDDPDDIVGGLLLVSSSAPDIRSNTIHHFEGANPSYQSDVSISHMEIFNFLCDDLQNTRPSRSLGNTSCVLKVDDGMATLIDVVSPLPGNLPDHDGNPTLPAPPAGSPSMPIVHKPEPTDEANEDAESVMSISHSGSDSIDFASPCDIGFEGTSSTPWTKWTSRDLCILERNDLGLVFSPAVFKDEGIEPSIIRHGDSSPTMLDITPRPRAASLAPSESLVAPRYDSMQFGAALSSEHEAHEDSSVKDGRELYGSSPCHSPFLRLPSLLSSLDLLPVVNLNESRDNDHDGEVILSQNSQEAHPMTELNLTCDMTPRHEDLIKGICELDAARNATSTSDAYGPRCNGASTSPDHIADLSFLKMHTASTELITELSALPHFSPLELSELTLDENCIKPNTVSVRPQLLRPVTSSPPWSAVTAPRTLWPTTTNRHHENITQSRGGKRGAAFFEPAAGVSSSDEVYDLDDLSVRPQIRKPRKISGTKALGTLLRSLQQSAVARVRPKSCMTKIFQLFSNDGATAFGPNFRHLRPELQIDITDRLSVPACQSPVTALTI